MRFPVGCLLLVACCLAAANPPAVVVPDPASVTPLPAARDDIPPAARQEIYRAELGTAYDPVQADQLDRAHELLETFFAARSAAGRKAAIQSIEATGIDATVLGRLCRIRSQWPALAGGGVFYVDQKVGPHAVRYFLGVPRSYDRTRAWPLVVKLADPDPFLAQPAPNGKQTARLYTAWITEELSKHDDAIVLMPLVEPEDLYGPSYAGMNSAMQPVRDAADRVNIDPARVYLVGHSVAAMGVWNIALHYPTYFASFAALAGAVPADWQQLRLANLGNVLPVVWHDDDDKAIKIGFAKTIVGELRKSKIEVVFDETRGVGHNPGPEIVQKAYAAMRSRVRKLYPTSVSLHTDRPDVIFNRNDWVRIDQELQTGKEHHLYFRHGTGHMTVYAEPCSVVASIGDNRITATVDNVSTLRFYVNDQMVNLAEPVTVVVNKKVKFEGILKPSVEQMLADQLFLGRGWRYYDAEIDIDMVPPVPTQPTTRAVHKGRIIVGPSTGE